MQNTGHDEIVLRKSGSAGRITLNRPKALNALTLGMVRGIQAALEEWSNDPAVALIILDGAGTRGLCAGGDIRVIHASGRARDGLAERFWREEYLMLGRIARLSKPFVPLMTGLVMGGGIGLAAHVPNRVVSTGAKLAMPEVGIGLIPDVGGTLLFARAPGEVGTYFALTGEPMGAAEAIALGLADVEVDDGHLEDLTRALEEVPPGPGAGARIGPTLRAFAAPSKPSPVLQHRPEIDATFSFQTVEEIVRALEAAGTEWASAARDRLLQGSPTSLKVTLAALRRARSLTSLEACLNIEYRLVCRCLREHDFPEGVRAAVIDKDRIPRWSPARLSEVSEEAVARHFAPLDARDDDLPIDLASDPF